MLVVFGWELSSDQKPNSNKLIYSEADLKCWEINVSGFLKLWHKETLQLKTKEFKLVKDLISFSSP